MMFGAPPRARTPGTSANVKSIKSAAANFIFPVMAISADRLSRVAAALKRRAITFYCGQTPAAAEPFRARIGKAAVISSTTILRASHESRTIARRFLAQIFLSLYRRHSDFRSLPDSCGDPVRADGRPCSIHRRRHQHVGLLQGDRHSQRPETAAAHQSERRATLQEIILRRGDGTAADGVSHHQGRQPDLHGLGNILHWHRQRAGRCVVA